MASLKMMRFSNVLRLVLSVGAKRRPRIDISSVEWFGKLKWFSLVFEDFFVINYNGGFNFITKKRA